MRWTYEHGLDVLGAVVMAADTSSPDTVRAVQRTLVSRGYSVGSTGADGKMGPKTSAAITKFQAANSLPQTGQIDQTLLMALGLTSASDRAAVNAQVALDHATAVEHAAVPSDAGYALPSDAQAVEAAAKAARDALSAATASPLSVSTAAVQVAAVAPPDLKAAAQAAASAAHSASTPEQADAAKQQLQKVVDDMQPSFLTRSSFAGVPWWQTIVGSVGILAIGVGGYKVATAGRGPRRRSA